MAQQRKRGAIHGTAEWGTTREIADWLGVHYITAGIYLARKKVEKPGILVQQGTGRGLRYYWPSVRKAFGV